MAEAPIYLGIGANLTPDGYDSPREGCLAALDTLADDGIKIEAVSPWYKTAPVPASDQPWFQNAVVQIDTNLEAAALMAVLHEREKNFGRVRLTRNEARVLDIDIVDFRKQVRDDNLNLPHPRMHQRGFVLIPLRDLDPDWHHPVTGKHIDNLIASLDPEETVVPA